MIFRVKILFVSKSARLLIFFDNFCYFGNASNVNKNKSEKFAKMKRRIKCCFILAIISILIRFPCLFGDFVFDDRPAIVNNEDVFSVNSSWKAKEPLVYPSVL